MNKERSKRKRKNHFQYGTLEKRQLLAVPDAIQINTSEGLFAVKETIAIDRVVLFLACQNGNLSGTHLWRASLDATNPGGPDDAIKLTSGGLAGTGVNPVSLTNVNGTLFFFANDGSKGYELWKSDGTIEGTIMVKDINTTTTNNGNSVEVNGASHNSHMENVNGTLFFGANDGKSGFELWRSDGTEAKTQRVHDINPSGSGLYDSSAPDPAAPSSMKLEITNVNGVAYFQANDGSGEGYELWRSNGKYDGITADPLGKGTQIVADLKTAESSFPTELTNVNGWLFFSARSDGDGYELWKSDGLSTTTQVYDFTVLDSNNNIKEGVTEANPVEITNVNGLVFFVGDYDPDGDGFDPGYQRVYKSDGTGVTRITGFNETLDTLNAKAEFTNVNGTLFFRSDETHLWKIEYESNAGHWEMTKASKVIAEEESDPTSTFNVKTEGNLVNANGILYFTSHLDEEGNVLDPNTYQQRLWRTNSTPDGTLAVPGPSSHTTFKTQPHVNVNGWLFFNTNKPPEAPDYELWLIDRFREPATPIPSIPSSVTSVEHPVLRPAIQHPSPVKIGVGNNEVGYGVPIVIAQRTSGGTISANDNRNLIQGDYQSAGQTPNELLELDITGSNIPASAQLFTNVNGLVYFTASRPSTGIELWVTDGTIAGTRLVKDILPGTGHSNPQALTNVDGRLFFYANGHHNGSSAGIEVWTSDGTEDGTVLVSDIASGSAHSNPRDLVNVEGALFFTAIGSSGDREVYRTTMVSGSNGPEPQTQYLDSDLSYEAAAELTNVNGILMYRALGDGKGRELWKAEWQRNDNGGWQTELVNEMVEDIQWGVASSTPQNLTNVNGKLLFNTHRSTYHGRELWVSDGTPANTEHVEDINNGAASNPQELTNIRGLLFFSAVEQSGQPRTLWVSDGGSVLFNGDTTIEVTGEDAQGNPITYETPHNMLNVSGTLYFVATQNNTQSLYELDTVLDQDGNIGTITIPNQTDPDFDASDISEMTNVNGHLHFESNGFMWKVDEFDDGGTMVRGVTKVQVFDDSELAGLDWLLNANGNLFFRGHFASGANSPWVLTDLTREVEAPALMAPGGDGGTAGTFTQLSLALVDDVFGQNPMSLIAGDNGDPVQQSARQDDTDWIAERQLHGSQPDDATQATTTRGVNEPVAASSSEPTMDIAFAGFDSYWAELV